MNKKPIEVQSTREAIWKDKMLPISHKLILLAIHEKGLDEATLTEISEMTGYHKISVGRYANELIQRGWAAKRRSQKINRENSYNFYKVLLPEKFRLAEPES